MWKSRYLQFFRSKNFISRNALEVHLNRFQSMNPDRYADTKALEGNLVSPSAEGAFTLVYIISKTNGLVSAMRNLIKELNQAITIKEINVLAEPPVIDPSRTNELNEATIAVIDTDILAHNYKNMPKLKWAHCTWAGIEPLFEIMKEKPNFIITRHGDEYFSEQMAEYVMIHVLMLEKNFKSMWAFETEKSWSKMKKCIADSERNRPLKELTLGVLGVGNMGQAIARFFKPHGTKIIGLSRRARICSEFGFFDKIDVSLTDILAASDYIINTLPSTTETNGLLNGDVLQACIKRPVFINVGRGNIIDEKSLMNALANNWLSHAVLDVFQKEPLPSNSILWNSNLITITPHCAAITQASHVARDFVSSFISYNQNKLLRNVVDWDLKY